MRILCDEPVHHLNSTDEPVDYTTGEDADAICLRCWPDMEDDK